MSQPFPVARPVVFPLFGVTAEGRCACGNDACSRVGKHPRVKWADIAFGDEVPLPDPGAGAGLKTGASPKGSGVFVIDIDSEEAADAWEELGGEWSTLTISTPRGWHLYFNHPGFPVKTSAGELAKGIDIRGEGGFVVAPGSPHASGKTYDVHNAVAPEPAPAWLVEWLQKQKARAEAQNYPGDIDGAELERRRGLYAEYLETAPARGPERRGQGDQTLFEVVQRGAYDLALPVEDVLELVREHYDPRCSPMWGDELEERVHHKAHDAKTNSTRPRAEPLPADLAHLAGGPERLPFELSITPPAPSAGSLGEKWGGWDEILLPPVYLLDGLIPEGKIVTFFAEGGSVKTWSALALAISVASGKPWLGVYHVKKGKVLYLDYEDGPYETGRRVRMLNQGEDVPDLGYLYGGPQIDQVDLWKALAKKVLDEGIVFIVVDSLGAGMPGDADENTTAFAAGMKIAGRFTEVPSKTPPTVLFVHHANKTGGMRGTSAARDQSDVVFKFEPVSETDSVKRMRMVCDKPGPQKRPAPVNVELSDAGLRTFVDEGGDAIRNAEKPTDLTEAIKLALKDGPMLVTTLRERFGGRRQLVTEAVRELTESGQVVCLDRRKGIQLDDDARRRRRVLAVAGDFHGSRSALAEAANVLEQDVDQLIKSGDLATSGTKAFVVLRGA